MRLYHQPLLTAALVAVTTPPVLAVEKDVPYVPTPEPVVQVMLQLANVGAKDVLYDLGSGDGRIVITAAKERGARGVGVDIDPERIAESRANAKRAGVTKQVQFIEGDLFKVDLRPATAVTLYLLPAVNMKLRPKLLDELRPGTPVVSHQFDMGDWQPEKTVTVGTATVYLWRIPARVAGYWQYRATAQNGQEEQHQLQLRQDIDRVQGTLTVNGQTYPIENGRVHGEQLTFTVKRLNGGKPVVQQVDAKLVGVQLADVTLSDGAAPPASLAQASDK
jgi:hypothetical protein